MSMSIVAEWTGGVGDDYAESLAFDGTFVYVGLSTSPGIVVKLDPSTMLEVARWTGGVGDDGPQNITHDGTYLYASVGGGFPPVVVQINPATMVEVTRFTGGGGDDVPGHLVSDGTYVYVSLWGNPTKVIQINPATMAEVARWTGAAGEAGPAPLAWDGTYIYAGLATSPAVIVQLNPATMSEVNRWTDAGHSTVSALVSDVTSLYAAFSSGYQFPAKIDPSTMTTLLEGDVDINNGRLAYGGGYLFGAVLALTPPVIKYDPATMSDIEENVSGHVANVHSLGFSASFLYAGFNLSPAIVSKVSLGAPKAMVSSNTTALLAGDCI